MWGLCAVGFAVEVADWVQFRTPLEKWGFTAKE